MSPQPVHAYSLMRPSGQICRSRYCEPDRGLGFGSHAQLLLGIVEMKGGGALTNSQNAADLPIRLAASSPLQALNLPPGQSNSVHKPVSRQPATRLNVEEDSDELEGLFVSLDHTEEQWLPFIGGEGQRSKKTSMIMDRNSKAATDAEMRGFVHQLSLYP